MKLAIAVVAVICLTAVVNAESEKQDGSRLLSLPEITLPELKIPQLLPKLQLPELKLKQQQDSNKPNRFRLSQLNIPMPNGDGAEMPKLSQLLPNISNPFNIDNLKSAAILSWLNDAGFYQLKNLTEEGGKVVIDMAKNNPTSTEEKPENAAADTTQAKDESAAAKRQAAPAKAAAAPAKTAAAPAKAQSAPATTAGANMRQGNPNGNKAASSPKPAPAGNKAASSPKSAPAGNKAASSPKPAPAGNNNKQQQHKNQAHGQAQNQKKP